jgi:hypothetical protein
MLVVCRHHEHDSFIAHTFHHSVDDDLVSMSRKQLVAEVQKLREGIRKASRQQRSRPLLASPGALGVASRTHRPGSGGTGVATVHGWMHKLSRVARRTTADRAAHDTPVRPRRGGTSMSHTAQLFEGSARWYAISCSRELEAQGVTKHEKPVGYSQRRKS